MSIDAEELVADDLPLEDDQEQEGLVAGLLHGLVDWAMDNSARSLYAQGKRIGVSDIGGCREYVRRLIADEEFSNPRTGFMAAAVGTAFGEWFEQAYRRKYPSALIQEKVEVDLNMGGFKLTIPGHLDIVDPERDVLIDGKTKNGLAVIRKAEVERKHQYQVTLYAAALIARGVLTDKATLAIAYWDRSGVEQQPYVYEWTYDPNILAEAEQWIQDVVYALTQGEEASKDMPREWCYSFCPYADSCRGGDSDVTGLIEDEMIVTAIDLYKDALARKNRAEADRKAAAADLAGIAGRTPKWTLRWIHVGESEIKPGIRRAHDRIDIRPNR